MKKEKNMNNKGFSLVELIVVIAIMAVLVGVLAPSLLTYVEKSRLQKDNSAISEICEAAKIAMADEDINNKVAAIAAGVTIEADATKNTDGKWQYTFTAGTDALGLIKDELSDTVGSPVVLTSNTYTNTAAPKITVKVTKGTVEVTVDDYRTDTDTSVAEQDEVKF